MNKLNKIFISALCASAVMGAASVYAYTDDDFSDLEMKGADGIYTVITDTEGAEHTYGGAINPKTIETSGAAEKIASYRVFDNDKEIISVKLNDIVSKSDVGLFGVDGTPASNGYYSVKFQLSEEENTEAYLTGLSETNLDLVQEELISAKLENTEFEMESLDFIDTEKTDVPSDGDDELCWAASTSNILHYTGWGQQAGFNSADDLFDMFNENFIDAAGNAYFGTEWFFNKINQMQGAEGWSQVKNYGESGGFLPQYSADVLRDYIVVENNHKNIKNVLKSLESGYGVGVVIGWIDDNGIRNGGHAITMWGYIIDKDFDENNSMRYTNIIIADSDSDMPSNDNRRVAPNKLKVLNMHPYTEFGRDCWTTELYETKALLEAFVTLKPYSDDIEYETDNAATRDKFTTADFVIDSIYASDDALDEGFLLNTFSSSDNIYIIPSITNSGKNFDGTIKYNVTVTKKGDNSEIFTKDYEYNGEIAQFMAADKIPKSDIGQYEAGEYTVKISVNTDKAVEEAYYCNNTKTYDFTVKNAEYDLSNVKINAQIGEFEDGTAKAQITYEGLYGLDLPANAEYMLLQSCYEDGKWGSWNIVNTGDTEAVGGVSLMADDTSSPPEQCIVYAGGEKIKFRLVIGVEDEDEEIILNIYSDEYSVSYQSLNIKADESNPSELTPLNNDENKLKNDETLKFKVVNNSTYDSGALTCNVAVIAVNTVTDETVRLYEQKNVSVGYGEESELISFNSWDSGTKLSGTYALYAIIDGGYGDVGVEIGKLKVKEIPNCLVTTNADITDEYDGLISLREAVEYCDETDVVTLSDEFALITLSEPIVIDKTVTVSGVFADETTEDIPTLGTAIYAGNKCQIFKVTKNGSLTLRQLALLYGKSKEYGGAVEVDGGRAELNECRIFNCSSGISGGGIYAHSGNVTLKNCSFKLNQSGYGGAVGIGKDATADMINCTFFLNTSNSGAVYSNGGGLTAVYSMFVDNTASSKGGSNITSIGSTNLVGCIAVDDEGVSLSGNINAFGSYIGKCDNSVNITDCENGTKREMFKLEANDTVSWHTEGESDRVLHYLPYLTHNAQNGVDVKNNDGKIAYCKADGEEKTTDVVSPFTDEEYTLDALGNTRSKLYGSYYSPYDKTEIIPAGNGLNIYTPAVQNAALITAYYDENNVLIKSDIQPLSLEAGTNSIDTEFEIPDFAAGVKYMLWDGLDTMRPIADALDMPDIFIIY